MSFSQFCIGTRAERTTGAGERSEHLHTQQPTSEKFASMARPANTNLTKNSSTSVLNEGGRGDITAPGDIDPQPSDVLAKRPEKQPRARRNGPEETSLEGFPVAVSNTISGSVSDGHVIMVAEIRLLEGSALLCDSVDMANTRELNAVLQLSRKAFEATRDKIAKRTQISAAVLKIMAGIDSGFLKLSDVIEQRHLPKELMDKFEVVSAEIAASVRSALGSMGATSAPRIPAGSQSMPTPDAAPQSGSVEGATDPMAPRDRPLLAFLLAPSTDEVGHPEVAAVVAGVLDLGIQRLGAGSKPSVSPQCLLQLRSNRPRRIAVQIPHAAL